MPWGITATCMCLQAHAVKLEQHFQFLDESVFPLVTQLLAACEAAGVPTAEAKEAAAKMRSRHEAFATAAQRQSVEAATVQSRLSEEVSRISTGVPRCLQPVPRQAAF